ncbi:splicing factor 1-like [Harpia harpyja]|uniref:splicing factor 1-like n=1 Tax=Harpia harpyja TaxID=202280 RepID=UPI0022B139CE|nr:splicing factor 1-like [Harpia harpyja]
MRRGEVGGASAPESGQGSVARCQTEHGAGADRNAPPRHGSCSCKPPGCDGQTAAGREPRRASSPPCLHILPAGGGGGSVGPACTSCLQGGEGGGRRSCVGIPPPSRPPPRRHPRLSCACPGAPPPNFVLYRCGTRGTPGAAHGEFHPTEDGDHERPPPKWGEPGGGLSPMVTSPGQPPVRSRSWAPACAVWVTLSSGPTSSSGSSGVASAAFFGVTFTAWSRSCWEPSTTCRQLPCPRGKPTSPACTFLPVLLPARTNTPPPHPAAPSPPTPPPP